MNIDDKKERPTPRLGRVLGDQRKVDINPEELDEMIKHVQKTNLY